MYEVYQKYITQENFDPSLVPVSSIISLAKVAQRLIDGAEDIIFPANFFIGSPTATCNLTANGSATIKNATILGNATINGNNTATTDIINSYLNVGTIISTVSNLLTINNSPTTVTGNLIAKVIALNGLTTIEGDLNSPNSTITFNKDVTVGNGITNSINTTANGNLTTSNLNIKNTSNFNNTLVIKDSLIVNNSFTVNGPATFTYKTDTPYNSADGITREYFKTRSGTLFGSKAGWNFVNSANNNTLVANIDSSGKLSCKSFTTPIAVVQINYKNVSNKMPNNLPQLKAADSNFIINAEKSTNARIGCNNLNFVNGAHTSGDTNVKINGNLNIDTYSVSDDTIIPVGMIIMFNGSSAPKGWALCNGSAVNSKSNLYKYMTTTPVMNGKTIAYSGTQVKTGNDYCYSGCTDRGKARPSRYTVNFIIKL
jgi:hypothetical protein